MRIVSLMSGVAAIYLSTFVLAQTRSVAVTIDDLPFVSGHESRPMSSVDAKHAAESNRKLLAALARHHVPVTGFVIQKGVKDVGMDSGTEILRQWTQGGFDLGNHTYAHLDFNDLSVQDEEDQIVRGEAVFAPLMRNAGKQVEFFRFPYNHTGDTQAKHDAVAAFLVRRGYRLAPCTIENSDWLFNAAYFRMLAKHDEKSAARLRAEYIDFTAGQIDYFAKAGAQIFGYEPPEIMLLHDNPLNADVMDELLALFETRRYQFVALAQAESDSAYRTPEIYISSYGPMWAYRWARIRGVKLPTGAGLDPDPPKWVTDYK